MFSLTALPFGADIAPAIFTAWVDIVTKAISDAKKRVWFGVIKCKRKQWAKLGRELQRNRWAILFRQETSEPKYSTKTVKSWVPKSSG